MHKAKVTQIAVAN